ncbi:hypothetical protein MTO96_051197 [Rhipicephalus appendiculatus]
MQVLRKGHPGLSYEVPPGEIATPHVPKEQPQSTVQNKTTAGLLMESSNCFVEHMSPPPVSMATPPLRPTSSPGNNGQTLPYAGHPGLSYEVPPGEIATPHVPKEQPQSTVQNKTTPGLLMESSNCFVEHMSPPPVSMATPPLRPTSSPGNNGQTLPYAGHPGLRYEEPPGEIATPHVPKEQPQSTVQNKTTAGLLMESSNCFVEHMSPPPVSMATPPLRPTSSLGTNGQTLPYAGLQVMVMNMPLQMQPSQQM